MALMLLSMASYCVAQQQGASAAIQGGTIQLQVGKSHVLEDVESFDVSNPGVIDAQPSTNNNLIINARQAGSTTLMVRKVGMLGMVVYNVEVTGVDVENVMATVKAALGGIVGLEITQEGNVVVLAGRVGRRADGLRIDRQRAMFGDTILDLTDRSYMEQALEMLQEELRNSPFGSRITPQTRVNRDGDEVLSLSGTVISDQQKARLMDLAGRFFDQDRIVDQVEVNPPQVEIDIEVYSFDTDRARRIGSNTLLSQASRIQSDGWTFQTGPRFDSSVPQEGVPGDTGLGPDVVKHILTYPSGTIANSIQQELRALNDIGAAANISTQHASVRSGQTATIDNITEQNIKIESAFDSQLEQVEFGQSLSISPVVVDADRFETGVDVELSNLIGGTLDEPAVGRRTLTSSFISGQGQTVILGGNKQINSTRDESSTPFLAQIPIVNWWFKAKDDVSNQTVQVFFMTLWASEPSTATENPQSYEANAIKQRTLDNSERNNDSLRTHQRLEAEGLGTLFTGKSRFE